MKVIKITRKEFEKMHKKLLENLTVSPRLHPYMTEEEKINAIKEANNPPLPSYIDYYEIDGLTRYVCDR